MYTAALTLLSAVVFLAVGHGQAFPMRWCTKSTNEKAKCDAFKTPLEALAGPLRLTVTFSCVEEKDAVDCMQKIQKGEADLITLDGGEINLAGKKYEMRPIVSEDYGSGTSQYNAVAVVKKSNTDITFKTLKGKKSCHTGAGKTAGWNVPVGKLLSKGIMERDPSCNAYAAAGNFFNESCVPNVKKPDYDPKNKNPDNLCALCKNECNTTGNYSGYAGAFRCLMDGVGDVAFVKHTTVKENAPSSSSDYVYLCPDGSRADKPDDCYLEIVPSHAVMIKVGASNAANFKNLLIKASDELGINQTDLSKFQLFNSTKYNGKDLLFKDSTKKLVDVGEKKTYDLWLGKSYMDDLDALEACPTTTGPGGPTAGSNTNKPHLLVAVVLSVAMVIFGSLFK